MATLTAIRNKKQTAGTLRGVLIYAVQKEKTMLGDKWLVIGSNCVPVSSYLEMMTTKQRFRKTDGRQFYHFVQSFSTADDITPQEVNAIGLEFAQRAFPGYEVVIATHMDTNHLHNHLVVNSVSCENGKKLHQNTDDLQRHRQANDEICLAHGLSVLAPPEKHGKKKRMKPGEYQAGLRADSWKLDLIHAINEALEYAIDRESFIENSGKPLSECTIEGVHACLCGILSDAMEGGFLAHNPAWRTYKYSGKKKEKIIADEETVRELIEALEKESLKYETYFKLIIATGMRRGECCGLKWSDIDYGKNRIHIQRNVVKITGEEIIVKDTKTAAGDRYVYFSPEMASLLKEYRRECNWQAEAYENRQLTDDDYVFRKHDSLEPMTPSTFTWRFKLILKKHGLPEKLNVHSLRHTNASLLIAGGADVATVAGLLGHSQPSTTLDIYTHAFDKNKKAASEALQQGLDI